MGHQTLEVRPLTLKIGAEIGGIDLSRSLDDRQVKELKDAIAQHQVISSATSA